MYSDQYYIVQEIYRIEEAGRDAYRKGKSIESCPYKEQANISVWRFGYVDEEEADARRAMDLPMCDAC